MKKKILMWVLALIYTVSLGSYNVVTILPSGVSAQDIEGSTSTDNTTQASVPDNSVVEPESVPDNSVVEPESVPDNSVVEPESVPDNSVVEPESVPDNSVVEPESVPDNSVVEPESVPDSNNLGSYENQSDIKDENKDDVSIVSISGDYDSNENTSGQVSGYLPTMQSDTGKDKLEVIVTESPLTTIETYVPMSDEDKVKSSNSGSSSDINNMDNNVSEMQKDHPIIPEPKEYVPDMFKIINRYALGTQLQDQDIIVNIPKDIHIEKIQKDQKSNIVFEKGSAAFSYTPGVDKSILNISSQTIPSDELSLDATHDDIGGADPVLSEEGNAIKSFEFGVDGQDIVFSEPVKVQVDLGTNQYNGQTIQIVAKHGTDEEFGTVGLSTNPNTMCDAQGNATIPGSDAEVESGKATFYTCRASVFTVLIDDIGGGGYCDKGYICKQVTLSGNILSYNISIYVSGYNDLSISDIITSGSDYVNLNPASISILSGSIPISPSSIISGWIQNSSGYYIGFTGTLAGRSGQNIKISYTGEALSGGNYKIRNNLTLTSLSLGVSTKVFEGYTDAEGVRLDINKVASFTGTSTEELTIGSGNDLHIGDWYKYYITVGNNGTPQPPLATGLHGDAWGVVMTDQLPKGVKYVKHYPTSITGVDQLLVTTDGSGIDTVQWFLTGALKEGETRTLELHVKITDQITGSLDGSNQFTNTATVSLKTGDYNTIGSYSILSGIDSEINQVYLSCSPDRHYKGYLDMSGYIHNITGSTLSSMMPNTGSKPYILYHTGIAVNTNKCYIEDNNGGSTLFTGREAFMLYGTFSGGNGSYSGSAGNYTNVNFWILDQFDTGYSLVQLTGGSGSDIQDIVVGMISGYDSRDTTNTNGLEISNIEFQNFTTTVGPGKFTFYTGASNSFAYSISYAIGRQRIECRYNELLCSDSKLLRTIEKLGTGYGMMEATEEGKIAIVVADYNNSFDQFAYTVTQSGHYATGAMNIPPLYQTNLGRNGTYNKAYADTTCISCNDDPNDPGSQAYTCTELSQFYSSGYGWDAISGQWVLGGGIEAGETEYYKAYCGFSCQNNACEADYNNPNGGNGAVTGYNNCQTILMCSAGSINISKSATRLYSTGSIWQYTLNISGNITTGVVVNIEDNLSGNAMYTGTISVSGYPHPYNTGYQNVPTKTLWVNLLSGYTSGENITITYYVITTLSGSIYNTGSIVVSGVVLDEDNEIINGCVDSDQDGRCDVSGLWINKTASTGTYCSGYTASQNIVRTINYGNNGNTTIPVTITDTLPNGVMFSSSTPNPINSSNPYLWSGTLSPGETGQIIINTTIGPNITGNKINNVNISGGGESVNGSLQLQTANCEEGLQPGSLHISKALDSIQTQGTGIGSTGYYVLTITGDLETSNPIYIQDVISGATYVNGSINISGYNHQPNWYINITNGLPVSQLDIALSSGRNSGDIVNVYYQVIYTQTGGLTNIACISGSSVSININNVVNGNQGTVIPGLGNVLVNGTLVKIVPSMPTNTFTVLAGGNQRGICDDVVVNIQDPPINGVCGSRDGSTIYDFNNGGDSLTGGSANLCSNGSVASFSFNSTTHTWSWNCNGTNGGNNVSCNASETYCGDGSTSNGEQCDDGNGVDTDACSNSCTLNTPSCSAFNFAITPAAGNVPANVTGTRDSISGFSAVLLSWGSGILPIVNPISPLTYTYLTAGNYTGTLTLANDLSGSITVSCDISLNYSLDGICGPTNNTTIYDFNDGGDSLTSGSANLCNIGIISGFNYDSGTHTWSWNCEGLYGGNNVSCNASETYCGDDSTSNGEQCDGGTNCTNVCTWRDPVCSEFSFSINPNTGPNPTTGVVYWINQSGYKISVIDWGTGLPSYPITGAVSGSYIYNQTGIYYLTATVINTGNNASAMCSIGSIEITGQAMTGTCNSTVSGNAYYTGNIPSQIVWCSIGNTTGINIGLDSITYSCEGINGGNTINMCSFDVAYCGDSTVNGPEQCEDGDLDNNNACSNQCILNTNLVCNISVSPLTGYTGSIVSVNASGTTRASGSLLYGGVQVQLGNPISPTYSTSLNITGYYAFSYIVTNPLSGAINNTCIATGYIGYCGDGTINGTEQCDGGTNCTNVCTLGAIPSSIDLFINKTVSVGGPIYNKSGTTTSGTIVTWKLDYENIGTGVCGTGVIKDTLPPSINFVYGGRSGLNISSYNTDLSGNKYWIINNIDQNTSGSIIFTGVVYGAVNTEIINTAEIYINAVECGVEINTGNNRSYSSVTISGVNQILYCGDGTISNTPTFGINTIDPNILVGLNTRYSASSSGDRYTTFMSNGGYIYLYDSYSDTTKNITPNAQYYPANNGKVDISANGKYIVYASASTGLVSGQVDTNGTGIDVFIYDIALNTTKNITLGADGSSMRPSISADGRYVVFHSSATNLISGATDANGSIRDVFVYDTQDGTMRNITSGGSSTSIYPYISPNGMYIVFESYATGLISGQVDNNNHKDIILYNNLSSSMVKNISISGTQLAEYSTVANDGNVAFASASSGLIVGDSGVIYVNTFIYDHASNSITNITISGNNHSNKPVISADGDSVIFYSDSTNLDQSIIDSNSSTDTFIYNYTNGSIKNLTENKNIIININGIAYTSSPDIVSFAGNEGGDYKIYQISYGPEQCDGGANCTNMCTLKMSDDSQIPSLDINKTVNQSTALSGTTITWSIDYVNNSPFVCTGVKIADYLPSSGFIIYSTSRNYTAGQPIIFDIGQLNPLQTGTINITGIVYGTVGNNIINTSVIYSDGNCSGIVDTGTATTTIIPYGTTSLVIDKSAGVTTAVSGTQVIYTISVSNSGNITANDVVIEDLKISGLMFVTGANAGWIVNSGSYSLNIGPVNAGATVSRNITFILTGSTTLCNTANIVGGSYTITQGSDNYCINVIPTPTPNVTRADIWITKVPTTAGGKGTGEDIGWEIRYGNNGTTTVTGVKVIDIWPKELSNFRSSPNMYRQQESLSDGRIKYTVDVGNLNPGEIKTIQISGNINSNMVASQTIYNGSYITGSTPDPNMNNNSYTGLYIPGGINVSISKSVATDSAKVNDNAVWNIKYTNHTNTLINNVTITDILPEGFDYMYSTYKVGTTVNRSSSNNNQVITYNIPRIAAGQTEEINITTKAKKIGTYTNNVSISTPGDVNADDNISHATINISGPTTTGVGITIIGNTIGSAIQHIPIIPKTGADR